MLNFDELTTLVVPTIRAHVKTIGEAWLWQGTRKILGTCNHPICDYMWLCIVCNYFCNYLSTSPNLGRICDYITTNVWLLPFSSSYVNASRIIFIHDKPPWPINCMCNKDLVTNLCTMCIMGMLKTNARLSVSILTKITLLINPYKILSNDSNGNDFIFKNVIILIFE
jgi:hypothetical protein